MSALIAPLTIRNEIWHYDRTLIFGVLNITPDSFSDGGEYFDLDRAVEHAKKLIDEGADAIDIGGESTRPYAEPLDEVEELERVIPVIKKLRQTYQIPLSIDTYKSKVAKEAMKAGADIINDISGGSLDPKIYDVAAETEAVFIIGHLRGKPRTMKENARFQDVVHEVIEELLDRVRKAIKAGVKAEKIWIDPCIGFGKDANESALLLAKGQRLRDEIGYPLMIGPSRKSFIGDITQKPVSERLWGTAAASAVSIARGADALRIHDVEAIKQVCLVADAICRKDRM